MSDTPRTTHLDRMMTELGLKNHELAAKVPTSRQAIYKLRNGNTRMLPHWAKRLAPHLGVSWQELIDGCTSPVDQVRPALLGAMDDETKAFLLALEARLMTLMNDQHERLIDTMTSLRRDFQNTKGFLIEDSLVLGQRTFNVENRLDGLERKQG
jgi:DNA-binding XRE family transcriptional regulator